MKLLGQDHTSSKNMNPNFRGITLIWPPPNLVSRWCLTIPPHRLSSSLALFGTTCPSVDQYYNNCALLQRHWGSWTKLNDLFRPKNLVTKPEPDPESRMSDSQFGGLSGTFKINLKIIVICLGSTFPFPCNLLK